MLDADSQVEVMAELTRRLTADRALLDQLRQEIRGLRPAVRRIQPRAATALSLVGTDGGDNSLRFDPFLVHLVRVVDSSNNAYCLEAITPSTDTRALGARQFHPDGRPRTPLGELMAYLGVATLPALSPMIPDTRSVSSGNPTWVRVYRELMEWAILFSLVRTRDFATDTLLVFDGLLRCLYFRGDLFARVRAGLTEAIARQWERSRRRIYLAGLAKYSKVLERYRLAMALEQVLTTGYAAYVEIPRDLEEQAYAWAEHARGDDRAAETGGVNRTVAGKMFFVKFGAGPRDPIWPVDLYLPQAAEAPILLGYLLADAQNGFPVPFYPLCLQRAHQNAALVDFDYELLQDRIFDALRDLLGEEAPVLDAFRLGEADPARARYA